MKKLLKIASVLVLLLVVGVVIAVFSINGLVKKGIEAGGAYALGVPTTLSSASVGLLGGSLSLSGLSVGNPAGYSAPAFLTLGSGSVAVTPATLTKTVVDLPHLKLDDIVVHLERKDGKGNYQVIIDNLKKLSPADGSQPAPKPAGDEKKFIVEDLSVTRVTIHLDMLGGAGGDLRR